MSLRGVLSFELSWQAAAITAACLFALAAIARLVRRPRLPAAAAVIQELGTLTAVFTLWRLAGQYSVTGTAGALARAQWLWHAERVLHLPSEAAVQGPFLPSPLLIEAFNLFYAALHFTAVVAWLIWLFARHRDRYRQWRTTLVLLSGGCLLVQLIPVAPPRMLPGDGLVDTAIRYGQSMYGSDAGFNPDQLSAMPSVHVGWALVIGVAVVCVSRSRWRWLALGYPALTMLAVVVTANHFWLDGVGAALLLALALLAQWAGRAALRALAARVAFAPERWRPGRAARSPAARSPVPQPQRAGPGPAAAAPQDTGFPGGP
jgi:PAP2 superfamily protein